MKKLLSVILSVCLLLSLFPVVLTAFAEGETDGEPEETTARMPDWVITEISPDQTGEGTDVYSTSHDVGEFIEICNTSGRTLNLYDYCVVYNGNDRTSDKFERVIVESTPIKPGDYTDGSTFIFTDKADYGVCDLSNKPVNPETCEVAPGEVVVLWMMYSEVYFDIYNEGKGFTLDNFRQLWNIPEGVKVIAVDANGNTAKYGGHGKNFNVKNSAVGTYGIAKYSEELNEATNVKGSEGLTVNFWECEDLICWATVDFTNQLTEGSIPNNTYQFTWDYAGYAATDGMYITDEPYAYAPGRCMLLDAYVDEPTVGSLTLIQKMTFGMPLTAGDSLVYNDAWYYLYVPEAGKGAYEGLNINGILYSRDTTFTATADGVYTFDYKFTEDGQTVHDIKEPFNITYECTGATVEGPATAFAGETVTLTYPEPDCLQGAEVKITLELIVNGEAQPIENNTFIMPMSDVTVRFDMSVTYVETETLPPETAPVTEPETAPVTEAPTAPADTTAHTTAPADSDTTGEETGCSSVMGALALLALIPAAACMIRKRKD